MTQLREFAQHKADFDALNTTVLCISSDNTDNVRKAWQQAADQRFTFLSDSHLEVIREYGLLHHRSGEGTGDIALRTALLVGADGRERWRIVSRSVFDTPKPGDVLQRIRATS
jgi:peroxiredoxin